MSTLLIIYGFFISLCYAVWEITCDYFNGNHGLLPLNSLPTCCCGRTTCLTIWLVTKCLKLFHGFPGVIYCDRLLCYIQFVSAIHGKLPQTLLWAITRNVPSCCVICAVCGSMWVQSGEFLFNLFFLYVIKEAVRQNPFTLYPLIQVPATGHYVLNHFYLLAKFLMFRYLIQNIFCV